MLPILYQRTKSGVVKYWKISIQTGDPDQDGSEHPLIVKASGKLAPHSNKHPRMSARVIRKGKNGLTPLQLAESIAEYDWRNKIEQGYNPDEYFK